MTVARAHATTFATPSDCEVVITRVVDAQRAIVWDCWTKPEHVPHRMTGPEGWTMPACEIRPARWRRLAEARDAAMRTGMKSGSEQSYNRLDDYLRTIE